MNKVELVKAVAEKAGITQAAASQAVRAFVQAVSGALSVGDTVSIAGFGRFGVTERRPRKARNPQTGQEIVVPARKVPVFKAGAALKAAVR